MNYKNYICVTCAEFTVFPLWTNSNYIAVNVIKAVFKFLAKIINICNKEFGTPFQRCTRVFENAITDCYAKLGPIFSWLCSITYLVQSVCYIVKIFDYVCMLIDFINDSVIGVVVKSKYNIFTIVFQAKFTLVYQILIVVNLFL